MPLDIFSTTNLVGVVQDLRGAMPRMGLLDLFFPAVMTFETADIKFDTKTARRRIAPFVSPLAPGQLVQANGYTASSFTPAYVKPKMVFTPDRALKRLPGEAFGGQLSPQQRMQTLIIDDLADLIVQIRRRLEAMAAECLVYGRETIAGDNYPTKVVDFNRAAANSIVLTGAARWGQAGVKPLDMLMDWKMQVLQQSGARVSDVVMTPDVWKIFRSDADVRDRIAVQRRLGEMPSLSQRVMDGDGLEFMGAVDGFNIWVYAGWYVDPVTNLELVTVPAGTVILSGPELEGVQAFGAILDTKSLTPADMFPKSWEEDDPSALYLMLQSAPLLVPYRPNACLRATVL